MRPDMTFSFSVIRILNIPWLIFIVIALIFLGWAIIGINMKGIIVSLAAVLVFTMFHSVVRKSDIKMQAHGLDIKFGFLAHFEIPYNSIADVQPVSQSQFHGLGIRYVGQKTFAFITDTKNLVELALVEDKPLKLNILFFRMQPKAIRLSLQKPEAFIKALKRRLSSEGTQPSPVI
jgi:hypothetical protein